MQILLSPRGLVAALSICIGLAITIVPTRQWILSRKRSSTGTKVTTVSMWIYLLLLVVTCGDAIAMEHRGGEDEDEVYLKNLFFASLSYSVLMWLIKFAFLGYFSNLMQVFSKMQKGFYIFAWIYGVGTLLATLVLQLAYCRPVGLNWSTNPHRQCINLLSPPVITSQSILNLSLGILVLFMSLLIISKLSFTRWYKGALFVVAALGSVTFIICIVRFVVVCIADDHGNMDQRQLVRTLHVWTTIELDLALVVLCVPTFRAEWDRRRREKVGRESETGILRRAEGERWGIGSTDNPNEPPTMREMLEGEA